MVMTDAPASNLPAFPTPFIGRARESAAIIQHLHATRLLTLTGPGGSGKTRLALHAAGLLAPEFADGVWWCDLSPVTDPAYVPQSAALVLRLTESPNRSLLDVITEVLHSRHALLILDNCEHVLSACAVLTRATHKLSACPRADDQPATAWPSSGDGLVRASSDAAGPSGLRSGA